MSHPHVGGHGRFISSRLRVLTWNLWWRYGPWEQRARPIIDVIEREAPDVIAIQEVWMEGELGDGRSFAGQIATHLGFHHVAAAGPRRAQDVCMGNAILSRWPILHHEWIPLPALDHPDERRIAIHALIDGPRGRIPAFCVHLNYKQAHSHVRKAQARAVAELIASKDAEYCPPILCGDFNAEPQSDEIRMLTGQSEAAVRGLVFRDAWLEAGDGARGYTWDNRNPFVRAEAERDRRIDYIFVGEPHEGSVGHPVRCAVIGDSPADPGATDSVWPSDHFGLVADLTY